MSFVRYQKYGNKEYAYEVTAYWDKKARMSRQKTKYLGVVVDKKKKIFEKKFREKYKEKLILDFGDAYLINKFIESTGYGKLLFKVFEGKTETLFALLMYRMCYGGAMKNANTWLEGSYAKILCRNVDLSSQRISEFMGEIGDEELYRSFFREYISEVSKSQSGIIIDTTSLPNQIHMPLTSWGRSGEEIDKQIRFLLVIDKSSSMPIFFRILPGNIIDVSSLRNTREELKQYGVKNAFFCTDAGFFSEDNIKDLYDNNIDFLMRLPAVRTIYREFIQNETKDLESLSNAVRYGKRGLFIKQKKIDLFGKEAYVHIILDPERRGRETKRLILQTVDEKGGGAELDYELMKRGIMILISSFDISKKEIVPTYYLRQRAETLFGFVKDDLNILPLRVHKEETLRGFLFLQFLTLIVFSQLKKALGKEYSVEEVLLNMRNLKCKVYENEIIIGKLTKEQINITKKLGFIVSKTLGI